MSITSIIVIGINHKTAPLTLREKAYFAFDQLSLYLQDLLQGEHVSEAVLLSTCNRSELYCTTSKINAVYEWFAAQTTLTADELTASIYIHRDEAALFHMMQVACGLDSMVLGEPEILGQMKQAFSESCAAGAVGPLFHRLFQQIFSVAKEIRTTTAIGACPVSVASAALHFAREQIAAFSAAKVVVIGAGDTAELLLRYLANQVAHITVLNRSVEKAKYLGEKIAGSAHGLDYLIPALVDADLVFSATGSVIPIVSQDLMLQVLARRTKPIVLIDIAVPRDIEASVAELPNVALYCIDDLKSIIENNRLGREHAAIKARELIEQKSQLFFAELSSIDKVSHTIRAYRGQIEEMCEMELTKAKDRLQEGDDPVKVLNHFAQSFTKKLLHSPSIQLRQAGVEGRFDLLTFAKRLFAIPD